MMSYPYSMHRQCHVAKLAALHGIMGKRLHKRE